MAPNMGNQDPESAAILHELDTLTEAEMSRDLPRVKALIDFERLVATAPEHEIDSALAKMPGDALLALQKSLRDLLRLIKKRNVPDLNIVIPEDDPGISLNP